MSKQITKFNEQIIRLSLVIFFILSCEFVFAAAPTIGTISPSSGSTATLN